MKRTLPMPARMVAGPLAVVVLLLTSGGGAQATATAAKTTASSNISAMAVKILKGMSATLAAAPALSFTAIELYEHPSRQGYPLAYTNKYDVLLQRPNKLRILVGPDTQLTSIWYDGKTVTAFRPVEKLIATEPAPPTIDAALAAAYRSAATYFPFTDVIVADPYKDMASLLTQAFYVGRSNVVGGVTTDIVAVVGGGVFEEVWIGADDKLPRMIRAQYLDDPAKVRHELVFSNWNLSPVVADDAFTPTGTEGAKPIKFRHPLTR